MPARLRVDLGPPALPNYFYNNLKQIVQTPTQIMILNEMVHDARVIRMDDKHLPSTIRRWNGDSIGRWEGDTLVVDTTNFTSKTQFNGSSDQLHVVERFRRVGREHPHLPLHDRGSGDVGSLVDRRVSVGGDEGKPLRARVPRRQLLAGRTC